MIYLNKAQNSNGTHSSQITSTPINNSDLLLVPIKLEKTALSLLPFVSITFEGDVITAIEDNTEARRTSMPFRLDAIRKLALDRINGKCSAAIYSGVTVGDKHYKLTPTAQGNLATAQAKVDGGAESVIYAADNEEPTLHTADQIKAISDAAYKWGIVNTSYYAKLQKWIARETDKAVLEAIDYGSALPDDLMQELGELLAGAGINLADYAGMLSK